MDDVLARLQDVFREVFARPELELSEGLSAPDVEGWDSLKHIELVISVEDTFGVTFRTAEVAALETVGDLAAALRTKLGGA